MLLLASRYEIDCRSKATGVIAKCRLQEGKNQEEEARQGQCRGCMEEKVFSISMVRNEHAYRAAMWVDMRQNNAKRLRIFFWSRPCGSRLISLCVLFCVGGEEAELYCISTTILPSCLHNMQDRQDARTQLLCVLMFRYTPH